MAHISLRTSLGRTQRSIQQSSPSYLSCFQLHCTPRYSFLVLPQPFCLCSRMAPIDVSQAMGLEDRMDKSNVGTMSGTADYLICPTSQKTQQREV
ncbi:hypothetical protein NDU88_003341 [Pleurodeles waltl]|uniref:Uncharacterized protein n=1 Tax=Pleurodeles waltl TaxID=8319 RepID=A0AAV7MQG5_PLEWA|nr:hypothetical protein NDU88_003341 [Pleurodeles waltl]